MDQDQNKLYEPPKVVWDGRDRGMSRRICFAFAKGCGGEIVKCGEGNFHSIATYGIKRGVEKCIREAKTFWHIDNAYFGGQTSLSPKQDQFFRITKNKIMHDGSGNFSWDRFNSFGLPLKEWRKDGKHIVLVPPDKTMAKFLGIEDWLDNSIDYLTKNSNRKIIISRRPKSLGLNEWLMSGKEKGITHMNLSDALRDAWVLITDHSNAMVQALIEGVPVICTNKDRRIGSLETIESPPLERDILRNIAYNQWTLQEIKSGKAWGELNRWG